MRPSSRTAVVSACLLMAGALPVLGLVDRRDAAAQQEGVWLIAGDTHVHTDHSSDGSLPRQGTDQRGPGNTGVQEQIDAAGRAGLDFLALTDHRSYDQQYDPEWASDSILLIPGEEANGDPHATVHGAVAGIHDGVEPEGPELLRPLQQSVWEAHAQDASWSTAHPDDGEYDAATVTVNPNASAQGVDTVEAWNRASNPDAEIDYAENRWNRGFRFGVVGASDSHFRELEAIGSGPGSPATWVYARDVSERAVLDGLRAGRTTVSNGREGTFASLAADVDGDGEPELVGGDEAQAEQGSDVVLHVTVRGGLGTRVLVYGAPGRAEGPLATLRPVSQDEQEFEVPVPVAEGRSWFRVEVRGPGRPSGVDDDSSADDRLQALTSPVFLHTDRPAEPEPEVPLPPTEPREDGAVAVLQGDAGFAGFPDVASTPDAVHVVAETRDAAGTSVRYQRLRDPGAGPADEPVDLAPDSDAARFPRIAARGDDVWVTWQDMRAGQVPRRPDVYVRHSADGGRTWEAEQLLTDSTARSEHPAIALTDRGPVVAWADNARGPFDVHAQLLGVDEAPVNLTEDKPFSPGIEADTRSARYPASLHPALAVGPDGDIAVAWHDGRFDPDPLFTGRAATPEDEEPEGTSPDDWEVLVSRRSAGAEQWSPTVNVLGEPATGEDRRADRNASLVFDRDGTLHAAWDSQVLESSGVGIGLRSSTSTDGGATWAPPVAVVPDADPQRRRPSLGLDPDGAVRIAWDDSGAADWRWKVHSARLGADGWTDARQVTGRGNASWARVDGGRLVFTSDRAAQRTQRAVPYEVHLLDLVPTPSPPPPADSAGACPPALVPASSRADDDGDVHEAAIDCMVWWEIARGTSSTRFEPALQVTRGQMASFLARLVERSGGALPASSPDAFPDDDGSVHEASIDALAAAGVVRGTGDRRYDPDAAVSRAQMATFLVRTYELRSDRELVVAPDSFPDDDGSVHEPSIDKASGAGFTRGRDGRFDPAEPVLRNAMASFLARVLDLLVREGTTPPKD